MTQSNSASTSEKNPPAVRLEPPSDLKVSAKTLGTGISFDVPVANISRSGMLLQWTNLKQSLPFIENTLLELEMTTSLRGQMRRVSCFGKVVRKVNSEQKTQYGVRLIHNDENDHVEWMSLVTSFEKMLPQVP